LAPILDVVAQDTPVFYAENRPYGGKYQGEEVEKILHADLSG